tara:strand:+ start:540 stop:1727 length:1188 start_codon:yes stop_codon:yes gene_type:complete
MYKNISLLEKLGNSKKPNLNKIKKVLSLFDNPQEKLSNCILISGTNGKGTVAKLLSDILTQSKYKVGLYTSPHLFRINERIQINNKEISDKKLDTLIGEVIDTTNIKLSYFELLTIVSINYFYKNKNEINIFEVGLGGKYDATNVVKSKVSIITNIDKDHQEYLGNTISSIAREKSGIVRKNGFLSTNAKGIGLKILLDDAKRKKTKIYIGKEKDFLVLEKKTRLVGSHQKENLFLVTNTINILNKNFGFEIREKGMLKSIKSTYLPGRYQIFSKKPLKIIDTAHNLHAVKNLVKNIKIIFGNKKINILLGMLKDKRPILCIKEIEKVGKNIYLTNVPNIRSFDAEKVTKKLKKDHIKFVELKNVSRIINLKENLVVLGSNYLVGNLLDKHIENN